MSRSQIHTFLIGFAIFGVFIFVDLHYLAFFPLTVRGPEPAGKAFIIALVGGSCAGPYAVTTKSK